MLHGTKCGLDRPGLIRTYARSSPLKNLAIEDVPTACWATWP
jgi:hypothetical protein